MSAKKTQSSSSLREVLVTSLQLVLGAIAGVLVCAAWLVMKPVTIMDAPPSASRVATDRHEIVYVRGKAATRGAQGARKQKAFLEKTPGEVTFVEEDLNRWMAGAYGSKERTIQIQGIGVTIGPRVPAARLVGDELELGLEIGMDREGGVRTLVAQARGQFVDRGGRQVFVPRKIYLGSCPVPWNLGGRQLYQKLVDLFPVPENVNAAWEAVGQASVADNRLHLVIGPGAPAAVSAPAPAPVVTEPAPPATEAVAESAAESTAPAETTPAPEQSPPAGIDPATSQPAESTSVVPAPVDPVPTPATEAAAPANATTPVTPAP